MIKWRIKWYVKCCVLLCCFALIGCGTKSVKPVAGKDLKSVSEDMRQYQVQQRKEQQKQALIQKEIDAIKSKKGGKKQQDLSSRFDVKTDSLSAPVFFMNLMAGTDKNIVVHPDVNGDISLNLSDVTLDEVLDVVRDVYGFDYKKSQNIYTIFPKTLRTEIFPINYINVKRVGVSDTSVLTGNIESSSQSTTTNVSQGSNLSSDNGDIQPGSRIQTRTETDFWLSLNRALSELVGVQLYESQSADQQRKVITNPQAGVAIVTAMPNELAAVKEFLDKASLSVKRQVIIEAKIVEVQLSDSYQSGINWNAINGQLLLNRNASTFDSGVSITEVSEGVGQVFSSLVRISDVSQLLSLLATQGDLQVLSSPRVSTVNNQKAVIRVGSDRFFVTGLSSSTISNASSTTSSPDIELSSFFSGISLDVTPQIADDGEVILHIHPVVSTVTEEQKNIVVGDEAFTLPLALRDIRESDSIVKAASGQVVVLGGLMQERISLENGRRPGLSNIPAVGGLFKTKNNSTIKSELIILLKPIVVEQDSWVNDFNQSHERFKKIDIEKTTRR